MHRKRILVVTLVLVLSALSLGLANQQAQAARPTILLVTPQEQIGVGDSFTVAVYVEDSGQTAGFEFDLLYDETLLRLTQFTIEPGFGRSGECDSNLTRCALVLGPKRTVGGASVGAVTYGNAVEFQGSGNMAYLHFQAMGQSGTATFMVQNALLTDAFGHSVSPEIRTGDAIAIGHARQLFLPSVRGINSNGTEGE